MDYRQLLPPPSPSPFFLACNEGLPPSSSVTDLDVIHEKIQFNYYSSFQRLYQDLEKLFYYTLRHRCFTYVLYACHSSKPSVT